MRNLIDRLSEIESRTENVILESVADQIIKNMEAMDDKRNGSLRWQFGHADWMSGKPHYLKWEITFRRMNHSGAFRNYQPDVSYGNRVLADYAKKLQKAGIEVKFEPLTRDDARNIDYDDEEGNNGYSDYEQTISTYLYFQMPTQGAADQQNQNLRK